MLVEIHSKPVVLFADRAKRSASERKSKMTIPEVFIAVWGLTGLIGLIAFLTEKGMQIADECHKSDLEKLKKINDPKRACGIGLTG